MLGSGAQASDSGDSSTQKTVKYADLNLTDAKGVQTLYWRLTSAATTVCDVPDQRELARAAVAKHCVDQAMAHAIATVNNPLLTSLYVAKTGATDKRFAAVARID